MTTIRGIFQYAKILFKLAMYILAFYWISRQLREYLEDNDASQITVRKFNAQSEDAYPTYSFCVKSMYGSIYTENVKEIYGTRLYLSLIHI